MNSWEPDRFPQFDVFGICHFCKQPVDKVRLQKQPKESGMKEVNAQFGIAMTAAQYADNWQEHSQYFKTNGYYGWMSNQLGKASVVLEVGCGAGKSTQSLVQSGCKVVAIEVNEHLVSFAAKYLTSEGISVDVLNHIPQAQGEMGTSAQVTIIQMDFLNPNLLNEFPKKMFNAMVCWMLGASPDIIGCHLGNNPCNFTGEEPPKYRIQIHKRCYELGVVALKAGGTIQTVDRYVIPSWGVKDTVRTQLAFVQGELAGSNYLVTKATTFIRKMEGNFIPSNIQYVTPKPANGIAVLGSTKAVLVG